MNMKAPKTKLEELDKARRLQVLGAEPEGLKAADVVADCERQGDRKTARWLRKVLQLAMDLVASPYMNLQVACNNHQLDKNDSQVVREAVGVARVMADPSTWRVGIVSGLPADAHVVHCFVGF